VIHSLVEYLDGSVLAQLGHPDMRTPIANGLAWPERIAAGVETLDLFSVGHLDFEEPDLEAFPCLGLAMRAAEAGGNAPLVLNAANEVAVAAFLDERLTFTTIAKVVEATLERRAGGTVQDLEDILAQDAAARETASALVEEMTVGGY
jgi:1-deoxy-D-xylulose-5-phosphate reductoisomerase